MRKRVISALLFCFIWPAFGATTLPFVFTVSATITKGCQLGGSGTGNASFGTLDFGTLIDMANSRDIASVPGGGSITLTCTPGTAVTIAMDGGVNGGNNAMRYLARTGGTQKISYQLYQNAARSTVWGNGAQALSIAAFPATSQTYTVYGRLIADGSKPTAGTYTDSVTVTFTF